MTTTSNTSAGRPLGFGFGRAAQAAVAQKPSPSTPTPSSAGATLAPEIALAAAPSAGAIASAEASAASSTQESGPGAAEGVTGESTGGIELVAVLRNDGSRGSAIFAGVFGAMDGPQFRIDPMLKQIYLLSLLDGAVPGGNAETLGGLGALPDVTVVPVPAELAAGFKATLTHASATRWAELYDQQLRSAPAITRFALENDARLTNEVVARIMSQNGTPFTVQIETPTRLVFEAARDEYDDDSFGEETIVGRPIAMDVPATVATTAGGALASVDSEGYRALHTVAADRNVGDVVTYNQVSMFAVIAPDAGSAERIHALLPQDLKRAAAQLVTGVSLNGEPFALPAPAEAEAEEQPQSDYRP